MYEDIDVYEEGITNEKNVIENVDVDGIDIGMF